MSITRTTTTAVYAFTVCLCLCLGLGWAQENAELQIPPSLVECYNTSYFMNRDNRLPANIDTLISLIEKVENSNIYSADMRQLAVSLIHRFRQDGIQYTPGVNVQAGILPYSPTGFQFPKFRVLLTRLIPGNAFNFPNSTLTRVERCSLHFMLSSTIDRRVRGDENQVCNQLSQYRAQRLPRALRPQSKGYGNFVADADVELLDTRQKRGPASNLVQQNSRSYGNEFDTDWAYTSTSDNSVSQCPVEDGLIRTPWGTVSAGTLIAGVAAGLQQQTVQLRTLLKLARRQGYTSLPQTVTSSIDNRWAATLAGDLAEVALIQMPVSQNNVASVGAAGGWNDTVLPHWYFLSQRNNLEDTDAEIRGGLDGLILAKNIVNWRTQTSSLKLSQLLRMYYSLGGVLNSGLMACNRRDNFPTVAPGSDLAQQTSAFAQVLDREMQLRVTMTPEAIAAFGATAASSLVTYVPQSLNDIACTASSAQDLSDSITPMTNLYVFLDTSWQYSAVVDYVTYVLQQLNIHPYASTVTLLAAYDGSVIVNTTNYITDVYQSWNATTHASFMPGFNLPTVLRTLQNLTQALMNAEQTNSSLSGHSLVALIIPNTASVNDADSSYSTTELQYINEQIPDLRFIYYGGGSIQRFASFVRDSSRDLFQLLTGTTPSTSAGPVAKRIIKIPRRIINPRCGSLWVTSSWGTDQLAQYARPGIINFYRIASNFFFSTGSNRFVTIQSQSSAQYTICSSRSIELPMQNSTTGTTSANSANQNCVQISGNSWTYDLSNACDGYYTISQCPPLYFSVQTPPATVGGSITTSCNDNACQTPDQWRYVISVSNLGCNSGVAGLFASLITILLALVLHQTLQ